MPTTTEPPETTPPPGPSDYAVKLDIQVPQASVLFVGRPYYRVRIEVTEVTGLLDRDLFVHQRVLLRGGEDYRDEFIGVAGPVDLVDFTSTPDERQYLRKHVVDILLESHHLYDELVRSVSRGVQELVNGMRQMDRMRHDQTLHFT